MRGDLVCSDHGGDIIAVIAYTAIEQVPIFDPLQRWIIAPGVGTGVEGAVWDIKAGNDFYDAVDLQRLGKIKTQRSGTFSSFAVVRRLV